MLEFRKAKYVWLDGDIVPFDSAKIHVASPAVKYGASVFEGIRGYWSEEDKELYCFRLNTHYQRLLESMKIMRLKLPYKISDFINFLLELLKKNEFREDVHVRHVVYVGGFGLFHSTEAVGMFIVAFPRGRKYKANEGIHCCVSSWQRISDRCVPPRIKAGANYQNSRLAMMQAVIDKYDSAIMLNERGKVSEGPGECLFIVREGTLITSSVTSDILESITRKTVIQLAKEGLKLQVEEREVDRTELYIAQEAFTAGTDAEITPIVSIDRLPIGEGKVGPITEKLQNLYFDVVRGKDALYKEWIIPVYHYPRR